MKNLVVKQLNSSVIRKMATIDGLKKLHLCATYILEVHTLPYIGVKLDGM